MKLDRRTFLRGAAGTLAAHLLAGCSQTQPPAQAEPAPLPVVRLWGIGGIDEATHHRIQARLDTLVREKLGFSVELTMVSRSSYNERLNISFLQGDAPDLFAIYQQSAFDSLYNGGYLRNLNDWLDDAVLESLQIPRPFWKRTWREDGYYGMVQNSETMQFLTCQMSRETASALGVEDSNRLWSWEELHALLTRAKELWPDRAPLVAHYGTLLNYYGQDGLGDDLGGLVDQTKPSVTVENLYASEEYLALCSRMHQWYQEGLILPDTYEGQVNGILQVLSGIGCCFFQRSGEFGVTGDWVRLRLTEPTLDSYTNYVFWGVSAQSRCPDQAVTLLQAIYSDPEIALLLLLGEEGIDYTLDEKGEVEPLSNDWAGNKWAWPGWQSAQQVVSLEKLRIMPAETRVCTSPAYGFVCDMCDFSGEIEQCRAVVGKYNKGLLCGFLEPETVIPHFLNELNTAGIADIVEEKQRQLNEWLEKNRANA